jgi:putative FmdB family regulatory protein
MPLYEYQCDACQHRFERIQKFSDPLVDTCPVCGGPVHKLLSSPAIQFKGSGWYITDYARAGKGESKPSGGDPTPAAAKGESGGAKEASSPGAADTKTESKVESTTKSEPKSESKPPSSPA